MKYLFRLAWILLSAYGLSGCSRLRYVIDMYNFGSGGVIVLQVGGHVPEHVHPHFAQYGVPFPVVWIREPSLPSRNRDVTAGFGQFKGYGSSLPEGEVEIVSQLAELRDCREELRFSADVPLVVENLRGRRYGRSEFVRKSDCMWHPQPEKIYRKKLDMDSIRDSDAYRKTGQKNREVEGSRYNLNIALIFIENEVKVEIDNGWDNPWL